MALGRCRIPLYAHVQIIIIVNLLHSKCPKYIFTNVRSLTSSHSSDIRKNIFADDTKMTGVVNNVEDQIVLQEDLKLLETWTVTNNMKFNSEKCCVMHCGYKNPKFTYKLYEHQLRVSES